MVVLGYESYIGNYRYGNAGPSNSAHTLQMWQCWAIKISSHITDMATLGHQNQLTFLVDTPFFVHLKIKKRYAALFGNPRLGN
jgi:hypothetical protein